MEIYIVSGFSGSGKTTFIKKIIPRLTGKTALILNDYGEVTVEDISSQKNIAVYGLNGGCICCSAAFDFQKKLEQIIREDYPEQIILESCGVSKFSDVIRSYQRAQNRIDFQVTREYFITLVDVSLFHEYKETFGSFYLDQICQADFLFYIHMEQGAGENNKKVLEEIKAMNSKAVSYEHNWQEESVQELMHYLSMDREKRKPLKPYKYSFIKRVPRQ
ncbi:MAG: GTP-binding protein [Acetivibrio sp.]